MRWRYKGQSPQTSSITVRRLDAYQIPRVDFFKIDVEDMEGAVRPGRRSWMGFEIF